MVWGLFHATEKRSPAINQIFDLNSTNERPWVGIGNLNEGWWSGFLCSSWIEMVGEEIRFPKWKKIDEKIFVLHLI